MADVTAQCGIGRATVYRLMAAGRFPAAVKVGAASRWRQSEITRWIAGLAPDETTSYTTFRTEKAADSGGLAETA